MKRRKFIHTTTAALSLPVILNGFRLSAMAKPLFFEEVNDETDRVLILVQLNGGSDGLNVVLPIDQYANLDKVRPNILIPENSILKITDTVGLHPAMQGLQSLFQEEKLKIVQAVGYPDQNRSHFRSTDIWVTGSPAAEFWRTGWLGRYFESDHPNFPAGYPNETYDAPFAITMGSTVSETCQGTAVNFSLTLNDPFTLGQLTEIEAGDTPNTPYGQELNFLRTAIAQTNAYAEVITDTAQKGKNLANYPADNRLAAQLKNVALLIAGGLKTKVYIVNQGGYDTHANQVQEGDKTMGAHANLLRQLSEAISVFQEDLKLLGVSKRVIGMTFSEFGRRIRSNDSLGTDHGTAAPLMVFGDCANPGILGQNPEISVDVSNTEGVPMQYDFRDIYASLLMDWFGVSPDKVKSALHPNVQYLPVLRDCSLSTGTSEKIIAASSVTLYPNPFIDSIQIEFELQVDTTVRLAVFDAIGSQIAVLFDKNLPAGQHVIPYNGNSLPSGVYFFRLQVGSESVTKRMVKR